jgi:hypothetical protein
MIHLLRASLVRSVGRKEVLEQFDLIHSRLLLLLQVEEGLEEVLKVEAVSEVVLISA